MIAGARSASLESLRGRHRDEDVVVCGCGRSLREFAEPGRYTTIGVNDVGRRFVPDYLVVVNPRESFAPERWAHVRDTGPPVFLSQYRLDVRAGTYVQFRLGRHGGTAFEEPGVLHYTQNSPYVALCLAVLLGARRIGLYGVDFTDDHFFAPTGRHPLARRLPEIDEQFRRLDQACGARGVEIVNLSAESRLTAFRRGRLEEIRPRGARAPAPPPRSDAGGAPAAEAGERAGAAAGAGGAVGATASGRATGSRPAAGAAGNGVAMSSPRERADARRAPRLFVVNYTFQTAGDVIGDGLVHAAQALGVPHALAPWDDPDLPAAVERFAPDLVLVVHGRAFARRWGRTFGRRRTAVWLVDEPYEVDDTARYSGLFDHVFVNDPASLARHPRAAYLPLAYDPVLCHDRGGERAWDTGFIGGSSPAREAVLEPLARAGLLSYVVGGPWRSPALARRCRAARVPPAEAAALYRQTRVVVNVFRDRHPWNRQRLAPEALNPRIYEAVASGALVVSEPRAEIARVVPELPVFGNRDELVALVGHYLAHPAARDAVSAACRARLAGHTFAERLRSVIAMTLDHPLDAPHTAPPATAADSALRAPAGSPPSIAGQPPAARDPAPPPGGGEPPAAGRPASALPETVGDDWGDHGGVVSVDADGLLVLQKAADAAPGSERGLASHRSYGAVELSFEVWIGSGACFIAKIHQGDRLDQTTNSYHLMCAPPRSYLARHHHVLAPVPVAGERWHRVRLRFQDGLLECHLDDRPVFRGPDALLGEGHAFLGLKGGEAWLRRVHLRDLHGDGAGQELTVLHDFSTAFEPRVSIVTTVYDRVDCLRRCLRSVRALEYRDWEQIVVADDPAPDVLTALRAVVAGEDGGRVLLARTRHRHNDWGIGPAAAGLRRSRGRYVCFLSDDNGYTPDHLGPLVAALDADPTIGFAYSSCRYDGRFVLNHPVPRPGGIDLGQPLFRRELFARHLGDSLPFRVAAWDWHLIEAFLRRGVRWRHLDRPTFLFRLARYPQLIPA